MTKKIKEKYDPTKLVEALNKIDFPIIDTKHNLSIFIKGRARSNETRVEHIVKQSHELRVRDIELITEGMKNYFAYKKDKRKKTTYNYYLKRKGRDKGFVKISVKIDQKDKTIATIKTIFITYNIK